MTYTNMDLQSLPRGTDLRVGTDNVERSLQLGYWQAFATLQTIYAIESGSQYPEKVVAAGDETSFDTAITNLKGELTSAIGYFDEIWLMV